MFSVFYAELMKLKHTRIFWLVVVGALPANLVTLWALLPLTIDGTRIGANLQDMFYRQGQMLVMMAPSMFALMTAYIVAREYQERTISQLFIYPASRVRILAAKLSVVFLLIAITTTLSCVFVLVVGLLKHAIDVDIMWLGIRMNILVGALSFGTIPLAAALSMVAKNIIPTTVVGVGATVVTLIGESGHGRPGVLFPWLTPYWPVGDLAQGIAENSGPNPYVPSALVILALTFAVSLIFCIAYYTRADVHSGS